METRTLSPRRLGRSFWIDIGGSVLLIVIALSTWVVEAPGHPVYGVVLAILGFGTAARTVAEYTTSRTYRDAYLVFVGIAVGLVMYHHLF